MNIVTKFLAHKISGYIAVAAVGLVIALSAFIAKQIADYKQLQVEAAFCEGQRSVQDVLEGLQDRAAELVEDEAEDVLEEIKDEVAENDCASQRAPDAILRYHGLQEP